VDSWYKEGETYDSIFTSLGSSYEECRAEAVGLYLSLFPDVLSIFGVAEKDAKTITYVNWLNLLWGVVANGPESYSVEKKCWLQVSLNLMLFMHYFGVSSAYLLEAVSF